MSGDFGAELDAALSRHIAAIGQAAQAAHERIDAGIDGLASAQPEIQPAPAPAPRPPSGGAAVSFDLDEELPDIGDLPFEAAVDAEGIPMPEDNP